MGHKEIVHPAFKEHLERLAGGHFVNNMDLVEDDSEVGNMVGAINFMNYNESVRQIDENIAHVAEIVDSNSAASEETAAISEEQLAQIQTMVQMVEQFEI